MNKVALIVKREYLTRVRKPSFIIMTLLGPLLMASTFIIAIYVAQMSVEEKKIAVLDETNLVYPCFKNTNNITFEPVFGSLAEKKKTFRKDGYDILLHIPKSESTLPQGATLFSDKQPNIMVKGYIQNAMEKEIERFKLAATLQKINPPVPGIDPNLLESIKTNISLVTIKLDEGGKEEKSYTEMSMVLGFIGGLMIYFFIFLYGSQVMRGVIEEKTNRIVEIIVSSVRPFQLMAGKILGIALVSLTQFVLWILLTFGVITAFMGMNAGSMGLRQNLEQVSGPSAGVPGAVQASDLPAGEVNQVFEVIASINFPVIIGSFLFFFLMGYLLYAALFAAVGSAVDNEADTQQFVLPVTIPLLVSIFMIQFVINNPDGPASFWLSMIPLTSPVIMMIRIPFGVPYAEVVLSMTILVLGFLGATWLAAKIYRTGILMYGKKPSYREIWKWITYKG